MIQPDCLESVGVATEPEPVAHVDRPASVFLIVFFVALTIFEVWALRSQHHTVSQFLQHQPLWLRITLAVAWGVTGVHLFFGGPL